LGPLLGDWLSNRSAEPRTVEETLDAPQTESYSQEWIVIQYRRSQLSFADGLISEEVTDLWEPWMRHADEAIDDDQLAGDCARCAESTLQEEQDPRPARGVGRSDLAIAAAQTHP
jgi:hypothetical protein